MNRRFFVLAGPLAAPALLGGCAAEPVWAPQEAVARAVYVHDGPAALTLFTVRNVGSGNGAHTGLLINADQRVMFDPAGTFVASVLPEQNDVIFGMSPQAVGAYVSYHARETYYVIEQEVIVPPAVAFAAMRAARAYGAVPKAQCSRATSAILRDLPGIGAYIGSTWFPETLEGYFGTIPGATRIEYREDDADDRSATAATIAAALENQAPGNQALENYTPSTARTAATP